MFTVFTQLFAMRCLNAAAFYNVHVELLLLTHSCN
jgi:hypothetical protein